MNNYEYIIASLPVPRRDGADIDADELISRIKELCSGRDRAWIDFLLQGFDAERLDYDFYSKALKCGNAFIREYFHYDLLVRNTKVEFLNRALARAEDLGLMPDPKEESFGEQPLPHSPEYEDRAKVDGVLAESDILSRERGLDALMWDKAEELCMMHVFDIDVILSFVTKIKIAARWTALDPETGKEMFRRLVDEIRNTR